jgi:hypothetical protein
MTKIVSDGQAAAHNAHPVHRSMPFSNRLSSWRPRKRSRTGRLTLAYSTVTGFSKRYVNVVLKPLTSAPSMRSSQSRACERTSVTPRFVRLGAASTVVSTITIKPITPIAICGHDGTYREHHAKYSGDDYIEQRQWHQNHPPKVHQLVIPYPWYRGTNPYRQERQQGGFDQKCP